MSKPFLAAFGIAVVVIAFLVWRGFVDTKGNHLEPVGKIGKVRAQKVDDNEVIVVFDFRATNDADVDMVVRGAEASIDTADGSSVNGSLLAGVDLANVFRNYKELGEEYNPPLRTREAIKGHTSADRMVGFRFDVPEEVVTKRKGVVLRVEDITGPVLELKAK